MRKVVVTGIGIVSSLGHGVKNFWTGLLTKNSSLLPLTSSDIQDFDTLTQKLAGKLDLNQKDLEQLTYGRNKQNAMALLAAKLALDDSSLPHTPSPNSHTAVIISSDTSQLSPALWFSSQITKEGYRIITPELYKHLSVSGPHINISHNFEFKGGSFGCGSGFASVNSGVMMIRDEDADVVLVGNSQQTVHPYFINGDEGRVQSDGAAVLVLEELGHALRRNVEIYAEIKEFYQFFEKDPGIGLRRGLRGLVRDGESVDLVANEVKCEEIVKEVFETVPELVWFQEFFGGGLGIFNLATVLMIMKHSVVPEGIKENCSREAVGSYRSAISATHTQSGIHSGILLSKY